MFKFNVTWCDLFVLCLLLPLTGSNPVVPERWQYHFGWTCKLACLLIFEMHGNGKLVFPAASPDYLSWLFSRWPADELKKPQVFAAIGSKMSMKACSFNFAKSRGRLTASRPAILTLEVCLVLFCRHCWKL